MHRLHLLELQPREITLQLLSQLALIMERWIITMGSLKQFEQPSNYTMCP